MNYFDDERRIIEHFQEVACESVFFPVQSDAAIHIFESIHNIDNWKKWVDSSGKSDPPPDYYCNEFKYMMDVMRVDDHAYKNKKGKLINPTNMLESQMRKELAENREIENFPNVKEVLVNAITDLPTYKDHNYIFYKKNFIRTINEHKRKIDLYKKNHSGFNVVFFVFDESSAYMQIADEKNKCENTHSGEIFSGTPHFHFFDTDFLKPIIESDIDFLVWYTPFKMIYKEDGPLDFPQICVYDLNSTKFQNISYYEHRMFSVEC